MCRADLMPPHAPSRILKELHDSIPGIPLSYQCYPCVRVDFAFPISAITCDLGDYCDPGRSYPPPGVFQVIPGHPRTA